MTVTNTPNKASFLKERMIKYWISLAFVPLWILVLGVYYSSGRSYMELSQKAILRFFIVVNSFTIILLIFSGLTELKSKKDKTYWKCNSVKGELFILGFITTFQILAAITISAGTPSFHCKAHGTCAGTIFFTVACWVLPILFFVHVLELAMRARRIASLDPLLWSTVVWLVQWDDLEYYKNAQDMRQTVAKTYRINIDALEKGTMKKAEKGVERNGSNGTTRAPKRLMLPIISRIPPAQSSLEVQPPPRYSGVFIKGSPHQEEHSPSQDSFRNYPKARRQQRDITRSANHNTDGIILYIPEHIHYTVPILQPAPKPKHKRKQAPPAKSWYR